MERKPTLFDPSVVVDREVLACNILRTNVLLSLRR